MQVKAYTEREFRKAFRTPSFDHPALHHFAVQGPFTGRPFTERTVTSTALYFVGYHAHECLKIERSSGTKIKGTALKSTGYVCVGALTCGISGSFKVAFPL